MCLPQVVHKGSSGPSRRGAKVDTYEPRDIADLVGSDIMLLEVRFLLHVCLLCTLSSAILHSLLVPGNDTYVLSSLFATTSCIAYQDAIHLLSLSQASLSP